MLPVFVHFEYERYFMLFRLILYFFFISQSLASKYYQPCASTNLCKYEGWNFNSGNYLFTTDTK